MGWVTAATMEIFIAGAGGFVLLLVTSLEPHPEYPRLMTDLLGLIGAAIALCGIPVSAAFCFAAGVAYVG